MRYMILIYQDESKMAAVPKDAVTQMSSAYVDYTEAMKKAGVWLSGSALQPTRSATSVRIAEGKTNVVDGPYAETKEVVGGFLLVEAPDMAAAVALFDDDPIAAYGRLQIRPLMEDHRHSETGQGRPEFQPL